MIIVGILVILLAVGAGAVLFEATRSVTDLVQLDVLGVSAGLSPIGLVVAGAGVILGLWLGVVLTRRGVARSVRRRRDRREETRRAEEELRAAREENERRLEEEREAARAARERAEAAENRIDTLRSSTTSSDQTSSQADDEPPQAP